MEKLKKRYSKKQNNIKNTTRSGAGRDDIQKFEVELQKYAFTSWLGKYVAPRNSKINVPDTFGIEDDSYSRRCSEESNLKMMLVFQVRAVTDIQPTRAGQLMYL